MNQQFPGGPPHGEGPAPGGSGDGGPGEGRGGWPTPPGAPEREPGPAGVPGGDSPESLDEQALRRLLRGAVGDIEPSADALEQLRRAVPARRTRRRQALVGLAAAVILGGTALPALLHVADTGTTTDERHANTASAHNAQPETDEGLSDGVVEGSGRSRPDAPAGKDRQPDDGRKPEGNKPDNEIKPSGSPSGIVPDPANTFAAVSPTCDRDQLGKGSGTVGAADKDGRVYGAFRVVNISRSVCTVAGPGTVAASARGSADSARVSVVDHTPGDAATGLPNPTAEPSEVILQPGQAYEVRFAWIPAPDGGPTGCAKNTGGATPTPGGGSAVPSTSAGAAAEGNKPSVSDPPPPPPPPSVVLSHTPDVGEPAIADTKINDACAGTVYRTGPLATAP
ncbi:hypothetical protein ACH427_18675 [Streptomyces sp. NPDC020379]|uniref:hypothetical protein n=1 Tax=Streptomyces sp. NPDC020379 TaxID=3365071 RepID=UPI0037B6DD9D